MDGWELARRSMLVVVVFAATFLLLAGASALVTRMGDGGPAGAGTVSASPRAGGGTAAGTSSPAPSPTPAGTTAPGEDPVLVGAGDIAHCGSDGDEETAALLDQLPGTVFALGDNAYQDGAIDQFEECYAPSWGRHLDRTWAVVGNHDWRTEGLAGYRAYFGDRGLGPNGETWYARDLGTWRVIVLDSTCGKAGGCEADSPQGRWLAAELAASDARCTIALFHHPRFSSGGAHGDDRDVDAFWRLLYAAGADVVLGAHDHDYERFAPQDPDGRADPERGIREFVIGTGGRSLREFGRVQENSELRVLLFGVFSITLRDGSYEWQFHPTQTDFSDRGVASCH